MRSREGKEFVADIEKLAWSRSADNLIKKFDGRIMELFRDNVHHLRLQGQDNAINYLVSSIRSLEKQMLKGRSRRRPQRRRK